MSDWIGIGLGDNPAGDVPEPGGLPTPDRDAEMLGVPVWRALIGPYGDYGYADDPGDFGNATMRGRWLPEAQHQALVAVVEAARGVRGALECTNRLRSALDNLDATLGGGAR